MNYRRPPVCFLDSNLVPLSALNRLMMSKCAELGSGGRNNGKYFCASLLLLSRDWLHACEILYTLYTPTMARRGCLLTLGLVSLVPLPLSFFFFFFFFYEIVELCIVLRECESKLKSIFTYDNDGGEFVSMGFVISFPFPSRSNDSTFGKKCFAIRHMPLIKT